jgi:hypothetical protein
MRVCLLGVWSMRICLIAFAIADVSSADAFQLPRVSVPVPRINVPRVSVPVQRINVPRFRPSVPYAAGVSRPKPRVSPWVTEELEQAGPRMPGGAGSLSGSSQASTGAQVTGSNAHATTGGLRHCTRQKGVLVCD